MVLHREATINTGFQAYNILMKLLIVCIKSTNVYNR